MSFDEKHFQNMLINLENYSNKVKRKFDYL